LRTERKRIVAESGWQDFDTLESYIAKEQRGYPQSRGVFADLLRRLGLAAKVIGARVGKAGLLDVLGLHGSENVQGEQQAKLDVIANDVVKSTFDWMPAVAGLASEEEQDYVVFPRQAGHEGDRYLLLFDPLDGSSNIDANVSVGTIFSIHRCPGTADRPEPKDFLQAGREQLAAGYVIYGSSTMFVYTTGHGVHGFTLDPEVGEFVLSHEQIQIPDRFKCFSANDSYYARWDAPTRKFADTIRYGADERYAKASSRYIGSLVADFHRNLLYGGVFIYPADSKNPSGKLRLLYECAPLALVAEQAGGLASTGRERILDVVPSELHQRVPIVIGSRREVELYEELIREEEA
jgi:fructose-1,6-bisphosphatase I